MADQLKQIKEFPQKPDFGDDDLLLIQGQGTTYNVRGQAVKKYAEDSAKPQVELAKKEAQAAAAAAVRAEDAIQHPAIPDSKTGNWLVWDQVSESYQQTEPPVRAEGQDFEIRGYYPTLEALEAAVPEPEKGYAYGVGTEAPYDIYVWDLVHGVWVNNGPMTASGDMLKSVYDPQHKHQDVFAYADAAHVGKSMAGQTVEPTQGNMVTAAAGAEIFNDYRDRAWGTDEGYDVVVPTRGNIASGFQSHSEGSYTTATGTGAHAEGHATLASGQNAHAEGGRFTGDVGCIASGYGSHAEGVSTKASASGAHSEGRGTIASEESSHSEGYKTTASGPRAHAEGRKTIAEGYNSHSEGEQTRATGHSSHAEGYNTTASGLRSHAEGYGAIASGHNSHAAGLLTIAAGDNQFVIGGANVESANEADKFIIGSGAVSSGEVQTRANCFRVTYTGVYAKGSYNASGADYAELFEWADGNPGNIDRTGRFVTLEGERIRLAGPGDGYILGIVSGAPSVVGDVYDDQWQGMYLTDVFGRPIFEDVEVPEVADEIREPIEVVEPDGSISEVGYRFVKRIIIPAHTERRQKVNPDYDSSQLPYIPRSERPEWDAVGMLGKLVAVDDGTCVPNGWATVGEGGAATNSEERTKYRVMARLDDRHVRILIL